MGEFRRIEASYDDIADVLYVACDRASVGVRYIDGPKGLLVRVRADGEAIGITVEDFRYLWDTRIEELISAISTKLGVDADQVRERLPIL